MSIPEPYSLKPVDYTSDIERRDGELGKMIINVSEAFSLLIRFQPMSTLLSPTSMIPTSTRMRPLLVYKVLMDFLFDSFLNSHSFAGDDSPYPEVRSAVANTDDPDIPVSTIRAWVLGLIFTIIIPV